MKTRVRVGIVVVAVGVLAVVIASTVSGQVRAKRGDIVVAAPRVEILGGASIGVSVRDLDKDDVAKHKLSGPSGALVDDVRPESAAEQAGVRQGDVVVEFDGERVRGAGQLARLVRETPTGRTVKMIVVRAGQKMTLDITPDDRPGIGPAIAGVVGDRIARLGDELSLLGDPANIERMMPRVFAGRGRLGVTLQELTPQLAAYFGAKDGVLVTSVADGSPAAETGLKAGDVIVSIDDRTVDSVADVTLSVGRSRGEEITIKVLRDKKEMTFKAKIEDLTRPARRGARVVVDT